MRRFMFASWAAIVLLVSASDAMAQGPGGDLNALCNEAVARYQQITGRTPQSEPVKIVLMYKSKFCPMQIAVTQGETVRWVNIERTSHSVWFRAAGKPESDRLFLDDTIEMTFDFPPGEYPYLCGPHWESDGMVGTVTVKAK